jgi:hypothetical protein
MKYARIHDGLVHEVCVPVEGFTIDQCFHSSLAEKMVICPEEVQSGWTYADGVFSAPTEETSTDTTQ